MILIGNGVLLANTPQNAVLENGAVVIKDGCIAEVGATEALRAKHSEYEYIDADGALIMPGIVNAHHHFYSAFARGMTTANPKPSKNFMEILENLWWRLDKALTLEDTRLSAAVSLVDSIKCGVTSVVDHHAGFGAIQGSLWKIAEISREIGVRACLCYEVSDRCGPEAARESVEENRDFIEAMAGKKDAMSAALFGLHASFTISDETLAMCREAAGDAGFHVHVAEGLSDVEETRKKYGKRVVERFFDAGVLGPKTLAAHCIHITPEEMDLLAESRTTVVHNPQSNMGNAVGCSPLVDLMARGVRVGLGTDGYTHDMFESAKAAGLLQRHHRADPSVAWTEPYVALLQNNPQIAGALFGKRLGVLEPGAAADVIVADYASPTPILPENIYGHMHFGVCGQQVRTSVVNGVIVMRDRKLSTIDEKALREETQARSAALWRKL